MSKNKAKPKQKGSKRKKTLTLQGQPGWFSNQWVHLLLLFVLAGVLYGNTIRHDYTQDDAIVITENMFTTQGFGGFGGILKYDTFYGFFKEEGKAALVSGGRYRPFSLLTFAVEVAVFGMNPLVGHLFNVLWYAVLGMVLYFLIKLLFPPQRYGTQSYVLALVTALLFMAHPIHTEAVANIKGRDEILALLGSLGAMYFVIQGAQQNNWGYNILAALLFFCGLMAKENAITFLGVIPLGFYFFTKLPIQKWVLAMLPLVGVAILFLGIRASILGGGLGEPPMELMNNPFLRFENGQYVPLGFMERMPTVLYTLGKYLLLLIFPHPLTHDYYPRHIELMKWSDPLVLLSLLLYLALGIYALLRTPRKDPLAFTILFYLITLSIVSNIVFPIGTNMAERLLFMPSLGFCLAVALLLYRMAERLQGKKGLSQFSQLNKVLVIFGVLLIAFTTKTITRNVAWKDNYTLFTTDIKVSKNSAKLRNAVGGELIVQAQKEENTARKQEMLQTAAGHLQEAIRIHPYYKNAYLLMGNCYNYLEQYEASIQAYQNALKLDPDYKEAIENLGITYRDAGRYYGEKAGDLDKAIQYLSLALQYRPDEYETARLLGVANGIKGNHLKAIEFFAKATELAPDNADAWYNLGTAYLANGQTEEGTGYRQKAINMDPEVVNRMNQNK